MSIDKQTLASLTAVLRDLQGGEQRPIPASVIAELATLTRTGRTLHIDLAASAQIGAPLVTLVDPPDRAHVLTPLTNRQRQVAALIIDGSTNRQIADDLGISVATVKDHIHAILVRLNLSSRVALIAAAHAMPKT
jgi:DNA-binding NarL/FixJ family response regulator